MLIQNPLIISKTKPKQIKITDEYFNNTLSTLKKSFSEKFKKQAEELLFIWGEIETKQLNFQRRQKLIEQCDKATKQGYIDFFLGILNKSPVNTIQLFAKKYYPQLEEGKNGSVHYYDDLTKFKSSQDCYPSFFKY